MTYYCHIFFNGFQNLDFSVKNQTYKECYISMSHMLYNGRKSLALRIYKYFIQNQKSIQTVSQNWQSMSEKQNAVFSLLLAILCVA